MAVAAPSHTRTGYSHGHRTRLRWWSWTTSEDNDIVISPILHWDCDITDITDIAAGTLINTQHIVYFVF